MLNQTSKELLYESAWKSLLHSEIAAFDCFLVVGVGIWLSSLPQSVGSLASHCPVCTCTQREEVKHFFLEDHTELKMLGSSKVTDVLCRASVFRYV